MADVKLYQFAKTTSSWSPDTTRFYPPFSDGDATRGMEG
jgi:hypothetical protein